VRVGVYHWLGSGEKCRLEPPWGESHRNGLCLGAFRKALFSWETKQYNGFTACNCQVDTLWYDYVLVDQVLTRIWLL
jgi:hypothetical protein